MCGLSILIGAAPAAAMPSRLLAMHAAIPHRGPDGEGFLLVDQDFSVLRFDFAGQVHRSAAPRAGFAFRRLKICDLSELAAQPMGNVRRTVWIAFNGEVYNHRALRAELEALGHSFRTNGDTEVALAAYEQWGTACFARFEGMWAIAILDLRSRRVVVSRDRFGIKPLYWCSDDQGSIALASEIKQLLSAATPPNARSNRPLVEMYLRGGRYPVLEETFFEGIRSVPPATWAEIELDRPRPPTFQAYWRLSDFTAGCDALAYQDGLARVEHRLVRAVASHRVADVEVGALLSGGLDSSVLVALANLTGEPRLRTFSLGYRAASPEFCEMPYVDAMVDRDRIENHETTLDAAWVTENADRALWALEEPPLAMPAFAQFRIFEFCAANGLKVILDGQGADEIAAGYAYHQRAFIKDRLLGRRPAAALFELAAIARRESRSAARVFADHFVWPHFHRRVQYPWIADGGPRTDHQELAAARADQGFGDSLVNRQLYFDVRWGNVKIVLGYGDRNAMAHSIEARVPFFDRELVELLFSLPDTHKIGHGDRKRVLRDIARKYVPAKITERADRMGYGTPDEAMLRGPLFGLVEEAVNDPAFQAAAWVDSTLASRFVGEFRRGIHNDFRAVWRLFALSRWANRFSVGS